MAVCGRRSGHALAVVAAGSGLLGNRCGRAEGKVPVVQTVAVHVIDCRRNAVQDGVQHVIGVAPLQPVEFPERDAAGLRTAVILNQQAVFGKEVRDGRGVALGGEEVDWLYGTGRLIVEAVLAAGDGSGVPFILVPVGGQLFLLGPETFRNTEHTVVGGHVHDLFHGDPPWYAVIIGRKVCSKK